MLKINKKVEYALLVLKHFKIFGEDVLLSAKMFSEVYSCPPEITAKVLQTLSHCEILESIKGPHGGYRLMKPLDRISFYELNESIMGSLALADCLGDNLKVCGQVKSCTIISPLYNLNEKVLELFKSLTIEQLIQSKRVKKETEIKQAMLEKLHTIS